MNRNILSLLTLVLWSTGLAAQTIKTDVTVVGGSPAGISAGVQAARSGVKTLILEEGNSLSASFTAADLLALERIRDHYIYLRNATSGQTDSVKRPAVLPGDTALAKRMTDTIKNLTVMLNNSIRKIEKDGKGWEIKLQNGRTIKTDVVIDATRTHSLAQLLKIETAKTVIQVNNWLNTPASTPRMFRTTFASGMKTGSGKSGRYLIPAATLMPAGFENIFLVPNEVDQLHPEPMLAGQAAGAAAAFCAYFKTTSKNLNVRVTQGELLAYDARLIPYSDIEFSDRHAVALQHIGLTGILKAKTTLRDNMEVFEFDTAGTVSTDELRLPMKEYYSRSQIWFPDRKKDSLSIEDAVNLMMFIATRGEELRREIEAGWKSSFKFSGIYDPKRAINRREFAVLTDAYLQPFNRRIDLSGNLLN